MLGETRNATHSSRTKQDTADDFGNDTRLLDFLKCKAKHTGNDDDDGGLNDEEPQRIGGFELCGVSAANDAVAFGGTRHEEACHD